MMGNVLGLRAIYFKACRNQQQTLNQRFQAQTYTIFKLHVIPIVFGNTKSQTCVTSLIKVTFSSGINKMADLSYYIIFKL